MKTADIWNSDIFFKKQVLKIRICIFLVLQIAHQINISGECINISVHCDIK